MALNASSYIEVRTTGNDSNGGGFSIAGNTVATNLAATSANTSSPVVTSATYNFAAGDVGSYVYISAGTNWTVGWYKIASVAANAATLIGACATVASPTSGSWTIDRSQQDSPQVTFDGTTITASTAGTGNAVIVNGGYVTQVGDVGNWLQITGGTNFNTGWYQITAVSTGTNTWTVTGATNASTGVGAAMTGRMGGAFASPGKAGAAHVSGNSINVKSGTYTVTSATANVSAGCISLIAGSVATGTKLIGYGASRLDDGTKPILQASGISTFTLCTAAGMTNVENITFDGASLTSSRGFSGNLTSRSYLCLAKNCTNNGFITGTFELCEATGCSTQAAFSTGNGSTFLYCVADSNTITGFASGNGPCTHANCLAVNNSGGSSDGFAPSSGSASFINCTAYNNGRNGFLIPNSNSCYTLTNCIASSNASNNYDAATLHSNVSMVKCAGHNTGGGQVGTNIPTASQIGFITLNSSPFTNAAGNDFSLNNTASAGASCRAAGIPGLTGATTGLPGISTSAYPDLGAAQTQVPAATVAANVGHAGRRGF